MKERKCDTLFSFRRSNNRYSLHLEKPSKKEADVQLKRASWSSFPLLKFSSFDEKSTKEQLAAKSQSSEDVKLQHTINTPRIGCNFLRGSSASIRSAFSSSSSSSTSSSSSSSSSPSIRSSGSSGKSSITSILEGSVSDSHYDSNSAGEDNPPYLPVNHCHPAETHLLRSSSDVISAFTHNPLLQEERGTTSVPSLYKEEEKMSPTSPKILYAHKKTPDVKRKSRKQLAQELELMKENGSLPEKLELIKCKTEEEKENVIPRTRSSRSLGKSKSNFKFMQNYKFLSKVDSKHLKRTSCSSERVPEQVETDTGVEDNVDNRQETPRTDVGGLAASPDKTFSDVSLEASVTYESSNPLLSQQQQEPLRQSDALPYSLTAFLNSKFTDFVEDSLTSSNFGVISDIIEEEDSECDLSEFMIYTEESNCFERRLEDKLEMLDDKDLVDHDKEGDIENKDILECSNKQVDNQTTKKRTELKLTLVKPQHIAVNKVYRSRLLRHISEEPDSGASGSEDEARSSSKPGTPRSPVISIDDVFKQKRKEIEDGNKDDMSRVKDLTTRLNLSTRRPSYNDWLGTVKKSSEVVVDDVFVAHPPLVLEKGQQEEKLTEEARKKNLQSALCWLRQELIEMRQQDQHLARQLMQLRIELQRLRLLRSCDDHQALVDEVTSEAEVAKTYECNDLCEVPQDLRETFSPILREIGVTRMNITSRRFSLR